MLYNSFSTQAIENLLGESNTLAVLDFSNTKSLAYSPIDNRSLKSTNIQTPIFSEVWKISDGLINEEAHGNCTSRRSEHIQFSTISTTIYPSDNYEDSTYKVYLELLDVIQQSPHKNLVRFWNHIPRINQGDGDNENYKLFCSGRLKAFEHHKFDNHKFPAASVIGHSRKKMIVCALTTKNYPEHHANPRQVDAFEYPRQYGSSSPSFARATTLTLENQHLCFISGTASILGHNSVHQGDLPLQLYTTNDNILYLLKETGFSRSDINTLRVYIRNWQDYEQCKNIINELFPTVSIIYTQADICRSELLVEIECFAQLTK